MSSIIKAALLSHFPGKPSNRHPGREGRTPLA